MHRVSESKQNKTKLQIAKKKKDRKKNSKTQGTTYGDVEGRECVNSCDVAM